MNNLMTSLNSDILIQRRILYWGASKQAQTIQALLPYTLTVASDKEKVKAHLDTQQIEVLILEKQNHGAKGLPLLCELLEQYPRLQGVLLAEHWQPAELLEIMHCQRNILCFTHDSLSQELPKVRLKVHQTDDLTQQIQALENEVQLRNTQFEEMYQLFVGQQNKLETLLANSPVILFALNQEGVYTLTEGQSLARLGSSPGEAVGRSIYAPDSPSRELIPYFEKALQGESSRFSSTKQNIHLEVLINPIYNAEHRVESVVGICFDITAQKQSEQKLLQARQKAEAANLAKTAYLANMSHEIRTPLNAILGFAQILKRQAQLPTEQQAHLQGIIYGGEHLLKLINNVLELAKIEANKVKLNPLYFNLKQFCHSLEAIYKPQFQDKGLSFYLEICDELPDVVYTDEGILRQIVINLLGNALKFTRVGHVRVRVSSEKPGSATALRFEIEDTGIGIETESLDSIFNEFQQSRGGEKAKDSTGLGLAISQRFAHLMGGQISVRSAPGEGSCFTLTLPVNWGQQHSLKQENSHREILRLAPNQPDYRVLVVDDQLANRQVLSEMLSMVGFQVQTAADGQQALDIFTRWLPQAVLLDRQMPGMNGLEVTRALRALPGGIQTRIVMVSASAFAEELAEVYAEEINAFLSKPFKDEQVYQVLAEQLQLEYLSSETSSTAEKPNSSKHVENMVPCLLKLPSVFLHDLKAAVINSDLDDMVTLIAHIENEDTRNTLKTWAYAFEYEKLLQVIELTQKDDACQDK